MDEPTAELPIMLTVRGRRCVVVGGGAVGVRRAKLLSGAGAEVVIVAPQIDLAALPSGVEVHDRGFQPEDLDGALLVVAATNDRGVNQAVLNAAVERGVLVNRSDDGSAGDITFMSSHRDGPLTIAVHTGGASASAAGKIRSLISESLDPAWAQLLTHALPARKQIQAAANDPARRTELLRRLTDDDAMRALKSGGEDGLKTHYADIMKGLA